ncbi:type II secretion system F family protein [Desulfobacca acetoxidans]|uniref:Type II secretion system F domain protein n=1 Tax=Desulfobacca acetoxidans (strain ATCC 700848 / DSM 11109 / ASRB2) TaxID=880072 RepID=F2NFA8_DESAR|nr:type II secretion system F family protein [Desulfobacca acetoxidans]AEB08663.1 Type II secretion system F domain protein [Desulfobacca acetoxidans DSM 11109]
MNPWSLTAAVLSFAGVTTLAYYLGRLAEQRLYTRLIKRSLTAGRDRPKSFFGDAAPQRLLTEVVLPLGRLAAPSGEEDLAVIRRLLCQAGYRSAPYNLVEAYFGLRALLALGLGALYVLWLFFAGGWTSRSLLILFLPLTAGYYLPAVILRRQASERRLKIWQELPDVLDLLNICIEAGLSLDSALYRVSRELRDIAPVLSRELAQYFLEIQSGLPRKEVLEKIVDRNQVNALSGVVNVLMQSSRLGTDIAESLKVYSVSLRTERMQAAEEQGAKVSTKLTFPMTMLILPALLLVVLGPAMIKMLEKLSQHF